MAGPVLGRRVSQLRALTVVDRAFRCRARAPVSGGPARGHEPRRGPGRQGPAAARGAARAGRARVLRPGGYEPGPVRDGVRRRALRGPPGAGDQSGLHEPHPFAGTRRGARDAAPARHAHRKHARRLRSHRRGARPGAAAAAGRHAPRRRRDLRRGCDGGRLRQSPEPSLRLGAAQRRRHPRHRWRAGIRSGRRSAPPRPASDPQAFPGGPGRGGAARRRGPAPGAWRAAGHESLVQVRRGHLPPDSLRRRAGRALAGTERRPAVPHGARLARMTKPLEVEGLGYDLPGRGKGERRKSRSLVRDVSFTVGAGETLVLLGRSGSGKTTTLKLINRLLEPTSGDVRVAEGRAADLPVTRLRRRIGYVIQDTGLFPHFTVERNVGLVPRLKNWPEEKIRERVLELLKLVGLEPDAFAKRYPRELSGGQRQRVGVARALAADPPIVLMDEPFGALDPLTRAELQREFAALARRLNKTIVFVTHDIREAFILASRIGLFKDERLVDIATPRQYAASADP